MSVFTCISDKEMAKLTKINPNLNISARMSWSEFIRDFEAVQKTRSHVLSGLKPWGKAKSFFNLIIHSWSFFKQYFKQ